MPLDVNISTDGTTLAYTDASGVKQVKGIDLSDLVRVLSTNVAFDMGFLPIGTRYLGVKGDQTHIAVERPAAMHDVSFTDVNGTSQIGKIGLPPALFLFILTKANEAYFVSNAYVFAMRQDNVMLGIDGLYQYPTPNVYEEGRICWGHNEDSIKNFRSLSALNGAVRRFFTAPFNHDLFRTGHVSSSFPWETVTGDPTAKKYLTSLVDKPFKNEWLVAHRHYSNFDAAIKAIFKHGV